MGQLALLESKAQNPKTPKPREKGDFQVSLACLDEFSHLQESGSGNNVLSKINIVSQTRSITYQARCFLNLLVVFTGPRLQVHQYSRMEPRAVLAYPQTSFAVRRSDCRAEHTSAQAAPSSRGSSCFAALAEYTWVVLADHRWAVLAVHR